MANALPGVHRAFGLGVLTVTGVGIARIVVFGGGSDLVAKFGLPPVYPGRAVRSAPENR